MNHVTFVGNLTRDPEVVFSPSGLARAKVSIALDLPPTRDGEKERDPEFRNITVFGKQGENVGESLSKGDRIVVVARSETYKVAVQVDGEDKTVVATSYVAQHIGPELRFSTAKPVRNRKAGHSNGNGSSNGTSNAAAPAARQQAAAPAATAAPAAAADGSDDF
ncbi:single-stranded DNA-binding protein [Oerskovia enterophila]|uniref:Single-stranded DNA-binding protein n=1 Tax=Oerskovia enterophila TaxID=43678 RepID=A0ABX2Y8A4_9CELL|nr:single-stranded DNA-binding protein [Oerskovia enterophila]OCI32789.1 single-stranded DNA-binding protein [Oerskovia enterophila]